jgi:diguanylate cyclase (GGDEF)-like protein/PAS domain S-box-containing protein
MMRAKSTGPEFELSSATRFLWNRCLDTFTAIAAEDPAFDVAAIESATDFLDLAIESIFDGRRFAAAIQDFNDDLARILPDHADVARRILEESTSVLMSAALEADPGFSGRVLDMVLDVPDRISSVRLVDNATALDRQLVQSGQSQAWRSTSDLATLTAIFNTQTVGACVVTTDGRIEQVNQRLLDILGIAADRMIGRSALSVLRSHFRFSEGQLQQITAYIQGKAPGLTLESMIDRPDGSTVWVSADSMPVLDSSGQAQYFLGFVEDITDRRAARQIQRNSEERIQALFENSSDVIGILSSDGLLEFVSESIRHILGYEPDDLIGQDVLSIVTEEGRSKLQDVLEWVLESPRQTSQAAARLMHTNGSWRWMEIDFTNLMDVPGVKGVVITARDVTRRKTFEQQMERLAYYDSLTALPNRMHFRERLDTALAAAANTGRSLAVVFLDLDRFKLINDRYGHDGGDSTLVAVGQRILDSLRPGEMVARLGGDEFALIIENASRTRAMQSATRIIRALEEHFPGQQRFFTVRASAGIAISSPELDQPNELLRAADIALYRSKALGGGIATLFRPDMFAEAITRGTLERDLQLALDRQEMTPWFQPEHDLLTGELCGFEVLMRWNRSDGSVEPPEAFIPMAEELGIIVPLGIQVLAEACTQLAAWNAARPMARQLPISFNVSHREISLPEYPVRIGDLLRETGLDPSLVSFEIDDRIFRESSPEIDRFVQSVKAIGAGVVVDNFGGGLASWSQIRRLGANRVKIARDALENSEANGAGLAIVTALISMASTVGVLVTAVGLADADQVERARLAGCNRGQGYYLNPPLLASEVEAALFGFQDAHQSFTLGHQE